MHFLGNSTSDRAFGKFEFRHFTWEDESDTKDTLYLGMPKEFPANISATASVNFLDGKPAITIVGT
jgi:hypothetical protein